jgi:RNA polymerase sigma-70 factor (ECF subfamily)
MMEEMRLALLIPADALMPESRAAETSASLMNEEEFRLFYERTARPLWSYLARITGDSHAADDVLQEAFYRFYRAGARHEDEAHRRNSLFRIATNIVRDNARRAKHRDALPLDDETTTVAEPRSHTPELRTDLARALATLEPTQRELLWLAYVQGASHEEIAGITGLRAVSIRTLLLRARRKVAAFLTGGAP